MSADVEQTPIHLGTYNGRKPNVELLRTSSKDNNYSIKVNLLMKFDHSGPNFGILLVHNPK